MIWLYSYLLIAFFAALIAIAEEKPITLVDVRNGIVFGIFIGPIVIFIILMLICHLLLKGRL